MYVQQLSTTVATCLPSQQRRRAFVHPFSAATCSMYLLPLMSRVVSHHSFPKLVNLPGLGSFHLPIAKPPGSIILVSSYYAFPFPHAALVKLIIITSHGWLPQTLA